MVATRYGSPAQGWAVTAVDIAPAAIARLRAVAEQAWPRDRGACGRPRRRQRRSRVSGPFAGLVVCRFKPSAGQWASLLDGLRPGGRVLLCSFRRAQHERHGFPLAYCLDRA